MIPTQKEILIAVVDPDDLISGDSERNTYVYNAVLYFKQYSKDSGSSFSRDFTDGKYKAAPDQITLVSNWDLSILGISPVTLPCVSKNSYYESLATVPPSSFLPDSQVDDEGIGKSIGMRLPEEPDDDPPDNGEPGNGDDEEDSSGPIAEIYNFYDAPDMPYSLSQMLTKGAEDDDDDNELEDYKLLVRVREDPDSGADIDGRPYVGYMPLGKLRVEEVYVLRKATAEDVAADASLVEDQWLVSLRRVLAFEEQEYEPTEPITCPIVE